MGLEVGQIVRYEDRLWRVGLVNPSRARLDPVQGTIHRLLTAEFLTYGKSVNISPTSPLDVVGEAELSSEQHKRAERLAQRADESFITQDTEGEADMAEAVDKPAAAKVVAKVMAQATKPVAAKPNGGAGAPVSQPVQATVSSQKMANKERLAQLKEKAALKAAEKAEKKASAPPKEKPVRPCACGCGEQVTAYFAQGHDARFKGWMVKVERGVMAVKDLPPVVQKSFEFKKKPGSDGGYVTTKNYKGEPHSGYDKAVEPAQSV